MLNAGNNGLAARIRAAKRTSSLFAASLLVVASTSGAWALSEIQREELPPAQTQQPAAPNGATPATPPAAPDGTAAPQATPPADPATPPATTETPAAAPTETPDAADPDAAAPDAQDAQPTQTGEDPDKSNVARPDVDPNAPLPEVIYDLSKLPEPVRRMHDLLIEAARSGDPEKLRPLLSSGEGATQLSLADQNDDPIKFLKGQSGDEAGQEILAILQEVLEAGYVHLDAGTPQELYVWPYFFAYPLDKLTPQQKVEIYRIVTASDFEEMAGFGNYIFFRVGISPEGRWAFFVAGE